MSKLYIVRDWNKLFENNRSREIKRLDFVLIPNRHDGESYSAIMADKNASIIFSAWVLILQVASKCDPRGTLLRHGARPHNSTSLALKTRAPKEWFDLAFSFLCEHTDWLETKEVTDNLAPSCDNLAPNCAKVTLIEQNRTEQNRTEDIKPLTHARVVIAWLNEKSGKHFRETASNLEIIVARLKEDGVDLEGVKLMIERQCTRWKGTEQEEYIRPETLFRKSKFDSYYAAREQPITKDNHNGHTNSRTSRGETDRNAGTANAGQSANYKFPAGTITGNS